MEVAVNFSHQCTYFDLNFRFQGARRQTSHEQLTQRRERKSKKAIWLLPQIKKCIETMRLRNYKQGLKHSNMKTPWSWECFNEWSCQILKMPGRLSDAKSQKRTKRKVDMLASICLWRRISSSDGAWIVHFRILSVSSNNLLARKCSNPTRFPHPR